ncbi:MAG TPA: patatin-like protein, partial [Fimbriimonas sp.]|nr:patatin-like protein [Fimbriimonas sp.]
MSEKQLFANQTEDDATVPAGPVVEEIRFAVVMYGGIALCVYMSGITDVLLNMVISTARKQGSTEFLLPHSNLSDVQKVLRKAAQFHSAYRGKELNQISGNVGEEVDCKFVIDILSGTSAGGLNNIFLAKALSNEQSLDKLAELWVNEGDIGKLLNDKGSADASVHLTPETPPQSLLNSVRMQQRLLDAFLNMESLKNVSPDGQSRLVDHLDLYITATDLKGLEMGIVANTGAPAVERKNRAVFHLAYDPLGLPTVENTGVDYRNDFTAAHSPFLSFIGRATSCIVPAFEPIQLNDLSRLYYSRSELKYNPKTDSPRFAYFFPDYKITDFPYRYFGDGGYGDNFPFGHAIDAVRKRTSSVAVDRILLYVEPDPEIFDDSPATNMDGESAPRPSFLEHITGSLSVKATEKIREDVDRIREQSELLERIKHGLNELNFGELGLEPGESEKNTAYTNLRDLVAVDDITDTFWELIKRSDRPSVDRRQVRWLVRGIKFHLDSNFHQSFGYVTLRRRIDRACMNIDKLLLRRKWGNRALTPEEIVSLASLRSKFSAVSLVINRIPRLIRLAMSSSKAVGEYASARDSVFKQVEELAQTQKTTEALVDALVKAVAPVAQTCDLTPFAEKIRAILNGTEKFNLSKSYGAEIIKSSEFEAIRAASSNLLVALISEVDQLSQQFDALKLAKKELSIDFSNHDQKALPLLYGVEAAESNWINLCRVSPLDSKTLVSNPIAAKNKLAGGGLGHFGGFFHDMWRVHDILWGQLDAIENVIVSTVRQNTLARRELIFIGQLAVLKDFRLDVKPESKRRLQPESTVEALRAMLINEAVSKFKKDLVEQKWESGHAHEYDKLRSNQEVVNYALRRLGLEPWDSSELSALTAQSKPIYEKATVSNTETIELTGRSLNVLDGMLETVGEQKKVISIVGRVLVTVAKILTPGSLQGSIYRHWLGLA